METPEAPEQTEGHKEKAILIKRLQEANLPTRRFLKVDAEKKAFEKEWQLNLYSPEDLEHYPRCGICGGEGLVPLEADKPEMVDILRRVLPPTLEVITPRRQLPHFFFTVPDGEVPNKVLHLPNDPQGAGEIRAKNQYFVAAGTTIDFKDLETGEPKTGTYKILHDRPIASIRFDDFMKAVTPYMGKDSSQRITGEIMENGAEKGTRHAYGIRYATRLIRHEHLDPVAALDILKRWNKKCNPPMSETDLERMVKNAVGYAQNDPQEAPKQNNPAYQKPSFSSQINSVLLAKDLMGDYIFVVDFEANELFYYDEKEKIYSNKTEQLIKREIATRLDENFKTRFYNEISEFITATSKLVRMGAQHPEILVIKNGLLNVKTRELQPFSPAFYITNKLDVTFNQKIKYSKSENDKFLKQVVDNHIQREQLQELIGHTLIRQIITETSLVCLGKGGNGKSIFLTTIKNLLGAKNVSSHSIQQLCYDKFAVAELKGKLANICADLPHKELMNTGNYKAMVSGDSLPINIKHVQGKGETIEPYTKYLYSANHLPPIQNEEDCYAWYRRFGFADFERTFTPENSTPRQELLNKLSTPKEKSALLNWALEGLERLLKNGDISNKPDVNAIRTEYRKRSSTTLAYFDEQVTVTDSPNDWIFTEDWVRDYVTYCHTKGLKPKTRGEFVNDVEQHLSGIKKARIRPEPKANPLSAWRYVKIDESVSSVSNVSGSENIKLNTNDISNKVWEVGTADTPDTESEKYVEVVEYVRLHKNANGLINSEELNAFIKSKGLKPIPINQQLFKDKIIAVSPVKNCWVVVQ